MLTGAALALASGIALGVEAGSSGCDVVGAGMAFWGSPDPEVPAGRPDLEYLQCEIN